VIYYILFTLQLYRHQLGIVTAITIIHTTTAEVQASTGEFGTKYCIKRNKCHLKNHVNKFDLVIASMSLL